MDKLLACLVAALLLLAACQTPTGFVEDTRLGIVARSPVQFPVVFVNSRTGDGLRKFPENEWATVDVSGSVPPAPKAVYLSGLVIITHGTVADDAGDYTCVAQTLAVEPNVGQRTPHSIWIPANLREFRDQMATIHCWRSARALRYGINLNLVAYLQ